jgi:phosphate transport system permease protein
MKIRLAEEKIFKALMLISAFIIIFVVGYILFTIVSRGIGSLNWDMISKLPGGGFYLGKEGGVFNAILGSFYLVIGAVIISLIFSVPVTMYINFYIPKDSFFAKTVRFSFDILFGIPSIVYGAFGFAVMIYFGLKASLFGGIVVVGMLITPIIMRSLDEVARFIPKDLLEAPLSLGATRYEMVKIVLRQLMPGITTAVLLAIGRGIGDAATVLFTAGYTDNIPTSLSHPTATLPLAIFFQLGSPIEEVQNRAYASALILTIIILILSLSARYFSRKLSKNKVK